MQEFPAYQPGTTGNLDVVTISSCRIFRYRLPLVAPLPLAGGVIHEREGLLVRLESDSDAWGWGDVAPLPGFSREGIDEAEAEAVAWVGRLRGARFEPRGDGFVSWPERESAAVSPSVRFGLETALSGLARRMEDGAAAELTGFEGSVPINGLLAGPRDQVLADASRLRDGGCRAVKLKVGSRAVAEDVELTRAVRDAIGDGVGLRLDANRSWNLEQAIAFGREMGTVGIEYLEEPLREARLRELFDATGIPVALDESLLELQPEELEGRREVGAVVLKPTLLGGLARAREWAVKALERDVRPVVSSCFESGVGLLALAEFAWTATRDSVPAGLDTYRWLGADVIEPRIPIRRGAIEWSEATARAHRIEQSRLTEIRHD